MRLEDAVRHDNPAATGNEEALYGALAYIAAALASRKPLPPPEEPPLKLGDIVMVADPAEDAYCRRCGRTLKVAKWSALGIGPISAKKEAGDRQTRFLDARGGELE